MKGKFNDIFCPYRENLIAIYGLGAATEEILRQTDGHFHILGLLDSGRKSGEIYGLPILPLEELPRRGITVVIIAARPSSRRIIWNHIKEFCQRYDIKTLDMEGNLLQDVPLESEETIWNRGVDKRGLIKEIDTSAVVSFDIFDTLLVRQTLCAEEIFGLVQRRIPKEWPISGCFRREREYAERELSRKGVPTWEEIYWYLAERNHLDDQCVEFLKQLEWETEKSLLIRREEICQLLQYASERGKKVYLVSDMYLSKEQLGQLLRKNDVTGYEKIFVSCEYGITKGKGLFRHLLKEAKTTSIIHIGDSQAADVDSAERCGIKGFRVPDILELLEQSGILTKLEEDLPETKSDEDVLRREIGQGMFAARFFNSPFYPIEKNRVLMSPEDIGFLLLAPVLTEFTLWLWHKVKDNGEKTVLFGARDGYLVRQLFDELQIRQEGKIESVYFLTSRLCASLAGCYTQEDIDYVAGLNYSGSDGEMLQTRFLLTEEEIVLYRGGQEDLRQIILERAAEKRMCYQTYIMGLDLKEGRMAFVDFVSTGTSQAALQKIMGEELQGYYFIQLEGDCEAKKSLRIESFCTPEEGRGIYEDYFLLENILTAPSPSLQAFDESGQPQYLPEERTEEEIAFIEGVHEGIKEYFRRYLEIWGVDEEAEKQLSVRILNLLHSIPIKNDIFWKLQWTDTFYGRKEKASNLI